jgi:hypothetical protein
VFSGLTGPARRGWTKRHALACFSVHPRRPRSHFVGRYVGSRWQPARVPDNSGLDQTALAARLRAQDNVISREQAFACGLTRSALAHRVRPGGPWRRLLPGIYLAQTGAPSAPVAPWVVAFGVPGWLLGWMSSRSPRHTPWVGCTILVIACSSWQRSPHRHATAGAAALPTRAGRTRAEHQLQWHAGPSDSGRNPALRRRHQRRVHNQPADRRHPRSPVDRRQIASYAGFMGIPDPSVACPPAPRLDLRLYRPALVWHGDNSYVTAVDYPWTAMVAFCSS